MSDSPDGDVKRTQQDENDGDGGDYKSPPMPYNFAPLTALLLVERGRRQLLTLSEEHNTEYTASVNATADWIEAVFSAMLPS